MNTNNTQIRILCYGDSNTWGSIPHKSTRYAANIRWTGVLQTLLGDNYEIIEEGLSARTIDIDDPDHLEEFRNGRKYLVPCLNSHIPLDYVIIFLGTNDFKARYNRNASQVAESLKSLVKLIAEMEYIHTTIPPKVILVCPPIIDDNEPTLKGKYDGAKEKIVEFCKIIRVFAEEANIPLISLVDEFLPMGHLDEASHKKLAEILSEKIKNLTQSKL